MNTFQSTYSNFNTSGFSAINYSDKSEKEHVNYYPFGMRMPEKSFNASSYSYSFQGQEHDDEIKGDGNSVNYKYRMHDPRVGRFFAVDRLASYYAYNSTYAFSENKLIDHIELEGLEAYSPGSYLSPSYHESKTTKQITQQFEIGSKLMGAAAVIMIDIAFTKGGLSSSILATMSMHNYWELTDPEMAAQSKHFFILSPVSIAFMSSTAAGGAMSKMDDAVAGGAKTKTPPVRGPTSNSGNNSSVVNALDDTPGITTVLDDASVVKYKKTAIGRMDNLKKYDDIADVDTWHKTGRIPGDGGKQVTWPENRKWLQQRIDRGDSFIMTTDPNKLPKEYVAGEPNGWFTKLEYNYLVKKGATIEYAY